MGKLKVGFIPIEGGHFYKDALEEVVRAEDLGFDSVWMEEHHSVVNHYWPSPLPVLAGFATRTSRGFVLGAAIGYKPDEFALYGAELEKRGARFEEQLAIIKGLWTQESLAFKGRYYQVEGALEPKPVAKPHPPIWIGGWGDLTLKRAATLADNWIPGPTADLPRLLKGKKQFLAERAAAGRTAPITDWPLTRDVIIAETDTEARALAEKHIMVSYRKEYAGGWKHPFIDASVATDLDGLMKQRFLIGGPDQVRKALEPFVSEYGLTHLICRLFFPGMAHRHIMRELELITKEVIPAFL